MLRDSTVRWRCRRGKKELDVLLTRFLEQHLRSMNNAERAAFERLLALEDEDLMDLIFGRRHSDDADAVTVLARLAGGA